MAKPSDDVAKSHSWEVFSDPRLNELEERIDVDNQNVRQAEAQFRQVRARRGGAREPLPGDRHVAVGLSKQ